MCGPPLEGTGRRGRPSRRGHCWLARAVSLLIIGRPGPARTQYRRVGGGRTSTRTFITRRSGVKDVGQATPS